MKVLILTNTVWSNDNNAGNSLSNIFGGMKDLEIANIYCRFGMPNNGFVKNYFQITERALLKNLKDSKYPSGKEVFEKDEYDLLNAKEEKMFNRVRSNRFQLLFWARDLIWKIGRWQSPELKKFITDFNPDVLFQPIYYSTYLNDIALFIKAYTKAPMVGYVSDDVYTLRQLMFSPLYWIDRLVKRRKVKEVVEQCEYLYVISDIQKKEYENCFQKECRVLTKGAKFPGRPNLKEKYNEPLKLVYTGNIYAGRWKTLAMIGRALEKINYNSVLAQLHIYTMTPLNRKMKSVLGAKKYVLNMGGIPPDNIRQVQNEADILIHAESFNLRERLLVHQSFSTKIVDYLASGRCIFAVGGKDISSIDYLAKNDAAIIAFSEKEIYPRLKEIIEGNNKLLEYGEKAWECGKRNHQIDSIQSKLYKDLHALAKESLT